MPEGFEGTLSPEMPEISPSFPERRIEETRLPIRNFHAAHFFWEIHAVLDNISMFILFYSYEK